MIPGELKPILAALALPPLAPLLMVVLGAVLAVANRRRLAWLSAFAGVASLWLLSCGAVAAWLAATLLPVTASIAPEQLTAQRVQAIVVLGGGIRASAPEFGGSAQPSAPTLVRLHYGAYLAKQTGLPLAFSGGVGWSATGTGVATEAQAAQLALRAWGLPLRWQDDRSRDTAESAANMLPLLHRDGVTRIALVTHAWHMPRSRLLFERAGFSVVPAPTAAIASPGRPLLRWLPDAGALEDSRAVIREWMALQLLH